MRIVADGTLLFGQWGMRDVIRVIQDRRVLVTGNAQLVDPRGQIIVQGSEDKDEVVIADLDLEQIREVRDGWQFFRDLRPDQYTELTETIGKYR